MRVFSKIIELTRVFCMMIGTISNAKVETNNDKFAEQCFESLNDEAKEIFIEYMEKEALNGNDELIEYHNANVDKAYKYDTKKLKSDEINSLSSSVYVTATAVSPMTQLGNDFIGNVTESV